jgi:hypothetical protein
MTSKIGNRYLAYDASHAATADGLDATLYAAHCIDDCPLFVAV